MHDITFEQFRQQQANWLGTLPERQLIEGLLALCRTQSFYMVNSQQVLIYWSEVAAALTGYAMHQLVDKPCVSECRIGLAPGYNEAFISLPSSDGRILALKKMTWSLQDHNGNFGGGIGILQSATEPLADRADFMGLATKISAEMAQNFHGILSRSPAMLDVFHIIQNAAETAATVLVRGESGVGKELVARAIHHLSARRQAPFLAINCAALSSNLLESELFGHVRGAFTGAIKDHHGLFQRARGGTLFLDEVAELPLELQAKLLRVLQERNYLPVGGSHEIDVDVRIVAATHRSLREEVKAGRFREDLMYRLRVVPIFIPPLRERREDISVLIWHFIRLHNAENFRKIEKIDPAAMRVLLDYQWPGNIRELHNVVEYAFAVGRGTTLRLSELPPEFREPAPLERVTVKTKVPVLVVSPEVEKQAIKDALQQSQGRVNEAAEQLGMSRATFWRKRKHYGV